VNTETWAIVAATFLGPIFAVLVSFWREQRKELWNRRFFIFRTLMSTRRIAVSNEHVNALNLIEVDFHGVSKIQAAYRAYIAHLNTTPNLPTTQAWGDKRQDLLAKLLHELSIAMKSPIGEIDLRSGGYIPTAWGNRDVVEQFIVGLAQSKSSVPVSIVGVPTSPPPPAPAPPKTP
jgi:hypothetical protein